MEHLPFDSEWRKHFPGFYELYNLLEDKIPSTGHLGVFQALSIVSKHLGGHDRGFSICPIADPGDGKSLVLRQFQTLSNVNYSMYLTRANFLKTYGGRHLVQLGSGYIPDGVRVVDHTPDVSQAPELINMHTLIISEGEMVATLHDSSFRMLLSLWNSLIEEGYWKGGDSYNGTYSIGDPSNRVSFNLSLACTPGIFRRYMLSEAFISRLIPVWYKSLECERQDVMRRIENKTLHREPSLQADLNRILYGSLKPCEKKEVSLGTDTTEGLANLSNLLQQIRLDGTGIWSTGKRDAKNSLQLSESMALMNQRQELTLSDVYLSSCLVRASAVSRFSYKDESGATMTSEVHTASKAHFLALVCQMTGYDAAEFLSRFQDLHGNQFYSQKVIAGILKELGLGR